VSLAALAAKWRKYFGKPSLPDHLQDNFPEEKKVDFRQIPHRIGHIKVPTTWTQFSLSETFNTIEKSADYPFP
jgi:hypothetical protein